MEPRWDPRAKTAGFLVRLRDDSIASLNLGSFEFLSQDTFIALLFRG